MVAIIFFSKKTSKKEKNEVKENDHTQIQEEQITLSSDTSKRSICFSRSKVINNKYIRYEIEKINKYCFYEDE